MNDLTDIEIEIATLFSKGFNHSDVAKYRGVSKRTIDAQAARLIEKVGASNMVETVAILIREERIP